MHMENVQGTSQRNPIATIAVASSILVQRLLCGDTGNATNKKEKNVEKCFFV